MPQPLPLSPSLSSLDGRLPAPRERPESTERSAQRQAFGRLLDRFARDDRPQDATKESAAQEQRPRERGGIDESSRPPAESQDPIAAPAVHAAAPAAHPEPLPDAVAVPGIPTPAAAAVAPVLPAVMAAPAMPAPAATDAAAEAVPTISAPTIAAPPATPVAAATAANDPARAAAMPFAAAAVTPAASQAAPAEVAMPEPMAETLAFGQVLAPAPAMRRMATAAAADEPAAKPAAAAPAQKAAPAPQPSRLPARTEGDMPAAQSDQGQPLFRIAKAAAPTGDATAPAGTAEERASRQSGVDQVVASLTGIDSPRRTAALYHKVADAVRPGGDTPAPADQVAIRLVHAAAEGRRAIQMHLHPAELGSIDVKMQWQGDKLTAQFTVDRPETLQLLQREVPALERSLGQAGVNVDSGSLSFSLRQQQGNGGGGEGFEQAAAAGFGDGGETAAGEDTLGQVIRDGILSIRV